ncbi:MAG: hypothetical protein GKR77_07800 [Legionellales bacterium]|nr:hypothetical protein [Legionellales bacterium]
MMQLLLIILLSIGLGYICTYHFMPLGIKFIIAPMIGHHAIKLPSITNDLLRWFLASIILTITFIQFGINWYSGLVVMFCIGLFILAMLDWDYWLLPDQLTLSLLWLGLLSNCQQTITDLEAAVLGAGTGYVSLWLIGGLFYQLTGRWGMGYGDYKFLAAIGAWMGWHALPTIVFIASTLAVTFGICHSIWRKNTVALDQPFGYYLALSTWLMLIN